MTIARRYLYETADAVRLEALADGVVAAARRARRQAPPRGALPPHARRDVAGAPGRRRPASRATGCSPRSTTLGPDAGDGVHAAAPESRRWSTRASWPRPMADLERAGGRASTRRSSGSACRAPPATRDPATRTVRPRRAPSAGCWGEFTRRPRTPTRERRGERRRPTRQSGARDVRAALAEVPDPETAGPVGRRPRHRPPRRRRAATGSRSRSCRRSSAVPALDLIRDRHRRRARRASAAGRASTPTFDVPWTSERITPPGRAALRAAGIAPPAAPEDVRCPYCASPDVVMDSAFGPTQCRSLFYCRGLPPAVRGDQVGVTIRRHRRRRDDGRRHRPGRARGRHEVVLHDVDTGCHRARPRRGSATGSAAARREARARRRQIDAWVDGRLGRLRTRHDARRAGAEADLVIEAALEDLDLKRAIFRALDAAATPDAILATNTSALSVDRDRRGDRPTRARPRPALLQPGAGDGARRGRRRRRARDPRSSPRADALVRAGQDAGPLRRHARASSSTASTGRSRSRRCGSLEAGDGRRRGDRRRDARRRLPDGPVRADGPLGLDVNLAAARGVWERPRPTRSAPAVADPGAAGRGRPARAQDGQRVLPLRGRAPRARSLPEFAGPPSRRALGPDRHRERGSSRAIDDEARLAVGGRRRHARRHRPRAAARGRRIRDARWRRSQAAPSGRVGAPTIAAMTRDLHRPVREAWIVEAVRTPDRPLRRRARARPAGRPRRARHPRRRRPRRASTRRSSRT